MISVSRLIDSRCVGIDIGLLVYRLEMRQYDIGLLFFRLGMRQYNVNCDCGKLTKTQRAITNYRREGRITRQYLHRRQNAIIIIIIIITIIIVLIIIIMIIMIGRTPQYTV